MGAENGSLHFPEGKGCGKGKVKGVSKGKMKSKVKGKMAKGKYYAPGKGKGSTSLGAAAAPDVTPPQLAEPNDTVAHTPDAPDVTGPPPAEPEATLPATLPDTMPTPAAEAEECANVPPTLTNEGHGNDAATAPTPSSEDPIPDQATTAKGDQPTGKSKGKGCNGKGKKGKKGKGTPTTPNQPTVGEPATPPSTLATKGEGKNEAKGKKGLGKAKGSGKTKSVESTPATSAGETTGTPSSRQASPGSDTRQPARSYTSVSLLSDGSGPVEMSPLGQLGGDGRVKRVKLLPEELKERVQAMSDPKELDELCPGEAKRQREAMRRKLERGGLKPGLIEKFSAARTNAEKFACLKAFIMDPSLESVVVDNFYVEQAKEKSKGTWVEKSLCDLEQQYSSPEDREWLKSAIVNKQTGVAHPQDPENPRRRLYKVFESFKHTSERSKACGSSITAGGKVQANKAVRQSLSDHLTSEQAGFDAASVSMFGTNCNPAPKKNPKPPKALTPEEKQKKDFQKDLAQMSTLGNKARLVAQALTNHGITNQEATKQALGDCYTKVQSYSQKINDMVFKGEPFDSCVAKLDELKGPLEGIQKTITDAEMIVQTFERRQTAEKRKAEAKAKGNPKKKAKAKAKAAVAVKVEPATAAGDGDDAEWPDDQEWPCDGHNSEWEQD